MEIRPYFNSPDYKENGKTKIKRYCAYLYTVFPLAYLVVFFHYLFRKRSRVFKYEVSLCLIFKNEAPYLKEWLEYHLLIGVDHFYLYNNFSEDNYIEILQPYIDKDIVTLTDWPHKYAQLAAYEDCYEKCKDETHWLGYIDTDEFVNLLQDNDVKKFLSRYNAFPSVLLCWRMFGTSGMLKEDLNCLVTERFVSSWPWLCEVGKSFINNEYSSFKIGIHFNIAKVVGIPVFGITDAKYFSPYMYHFFNRNTPKAYINHYWSKSKEYYLYKDLMKGDVQSENCEIVKRKKGRFEFHELNNNVHDYSIQRWLLSLKERLA